MDPALRTPRSFGSQTGSQQSSRAPSPTRGVEDRLVRSPSGQLHGNGAPVVPLPASSPSPSPRHEVTDAVSPGGNGDPGHTDASPASQHPPPSLAVPLLPAVACRGCAQRLGSLSRALDAGDVAAFYGLAEAVRVHLYRMQDIVIDDRRRHLKQVVKCFKGDRFVSWLVDHGYAATRFDASTIGARMVALGVIHDVDDKVGFLDKHSAWYRFRHDDGTYQGDPQDLPASPASSLAGSGVGSVGRPTRYSRTAGFQPCPTLTM